MSSTFSGDETAPFFGFLGAAAALVFSCNCSYTLSSHHRLQDHSCHEDSLFLLKKTTKEIELTVAFNQLKKINVYLLFIIDAYDKKLLIRKKKKSVPFIYVKLRTKVMLVIIYLFILMETW